MLSELHVAGMRQANPCSSQSPISICNRAMITRKTRSSSSKTSGLEPPVAVALKDTDIEPGSTATARRAGGSGKINGKGKGGTSGSGNGNGDGHGVVPRHERTPSGDEPVFEMVVLGSGGGPLETDCSG